jgi:uncharacterized protein YbjT (DUF2867 family)
MTYPSSAQQKIVVIGGSGLIGSQVVARLREHGHEVVSASPSSGVDTITGQGVAEALAGAQVVVDVANSPSFAPDDVLEFFSTSTRTLLAAEAAAGVRHHVVLSVVGADRVPDSGYLRAKVAQEALVQAGPVPWSIVRATQFFEFVRPIADVSTEGSTVRLTPALMQPVAAAEVAALVADVAEGAPLDDTIELAGPDAWGMDEVARLVLAADGDPRQVVADVDARYFGALIDDRSITPGEHARIGSVHLADWLVRS